jgi:hypothetical protein
VVVHGDDGTRIECRFFDHDCANSLGRPSGTTTRGARFYDAARV